MGLTDDFVTRESGQLPTQSAWDAHTLLRVVTEDVETWYPMKRWTCSCGASALAGSESEAREHQRIHANAAVLCHA